MKRLEREVEKDFLNFYLSEMKTGMLLYITDYLNRSSAFGLDADYLQEPRIKAF